MDEAEPISIASGDVTVTKRYVPEEFAVPTISFEIRSAGESPVEVRLEDRLPEQFSPERIGFHPDYDSEHWEARTDGRVVFESRIDPETTLVTVYGVRITTDEEAAAFMTEPELAVSTLGPDGERSDIEAPIVADGAGETAPIPVSRVESPADDDTASVAAALAAELRSGSVPEADREALREALGATPPERQRVQLGHLQARVSELEAYADAFGSFLDENGTADRLVDDLRTECEDLREAVEAAEADLAATTDRHGAAIESLESDLDSLEGSVADRGEIAADVDAVSDDLDALYEQVDELRRWRDQLGVAFDSE